MLCVSFALEWQFNAVKRSQSCTDEWVLGRQAGGAMSCCSRCCSRGRKLSSGHASPTRQRCGGIGGAGSSSLLLLLLALVTLLAINALGHPPPPVERITLHLASHGTQRPPRLLAVL